jgi:hypothetical protein
VHTIRKRGATQEAGEESQSLKCPIDDGNGSARCGSAIFEGIKMAKQKKTKTGGPFLAGAFFCESIMEDVNKMLSAIKILDTVSFWLSPDAPEDMPSKEHPISISQNFLLMFKTGDAPGKHDLKLVLQQPDGKKRELLTREIEMSKDPSGGANVKTAATLQLYTQGLYWVEVILDGKRLTKVPLRFLVQRLPSSPKIKRAT